MGMTFNLGSTKGTATMRLKAWGIYNVTFKGIDYVEGTNKEGNHHFNYHSSSLL